MIQSLDKISFDSLYLSFKEAFKDYELQLTHEELRVMLERRGFDPKLSFGAFQDQRLVSFTCNGIGIYEGVPTAYDTGTGTIEKFRGKGLATRVFKYSIPYLQKAGVSQYLLEVLQHNSGAISVYKKLGFSVIREFNYFSRVSDQVHTAHGSGSKSIKIRKSDLSEMDLMISFRDFEPSWQNSFESVLRKPDDFEILGAYDQDVLVGYGIFEPGSGDITQIAVQPGYRRKGVATALVDRMVSLNRHPSIKAINTLSSYEPMSRFLDSCGIQFQGRQYEMVRQF